MFALLLSRDDCCAEIINSRLLQSHFTVRTLNDTSLRRGRFRTRPRVDVRVRRVIDVVRMMIGRDSDASHW
jgi:hypothetical protein